MSNSNRKKSVVSLALIFTMILSTVTFLDKALMPKAYSQVCSITETGTLVAGAMGASPLLDGANSVFVSGTTAYVTADGDDAFSALDITDPTMITVLGSLTAGAMGASPLLDGATAVTVSGTTAYVAANMSDAFSTLDVSDPTMISVLGSLTAGAMGASPFLDGINSVFISGTKAYVTADGSDALSVIDITSPTMISVLGSITAGAMGAAPLLDNASSVFVSGTTAYVTASMSKSLSAFDVTDPTMITELGSIVDGAGATELNGANSVVVVGTKAYVTSDSDKSLSIFDVTDPTMITELGTIKDGVGATQLNGAHGVVISGNRAYVTSSTDKSLSIFNITTASMISEVSTIVDGAGATNINGANSLFLLSGSVYTTASSDKALSVFNISNACTVNATTVENEGAKNNVSAPVITSPATGETTGPSPVISGTAVRGVRIVVRDGGILLASTYSSSIDGTWTLSTYPALSNGPHTLTAIVDSSADTSSPSAPVSITVEGGADATPTPTPTPEESPSPTPEESPSPTPEESPSPTPEESPSPTPEESPSPTPDEGVLEPEQLTPSIDVTGDTSIQLEKSNKSRANSARLEVTGSNLDSKLKCEASATGNADVSITPKKFFISPKKDSSKIKVKVKNSSVKSIIDSGSSSSVTITVNCGSLSDSQDITISP